jgi:hypothetical protein
MRLLVSLVLVCLCLMLLVYWASDPFDPPIGPRNPRPGAERYLRTRKELSPEQRQALLALQPVPSDLLRALSTAPSREIRAYVAASPSADSALLQGFLHDPEPAVRAYVASNPRTPHTLLLELKNDPDENVRWVLPRNPNWTGDEIRQMHRDGATSATVIASNVSTPADLLDELSRLDDYGIRSALVGNPSISEAAARRLAQDLRSSIRLRLTYNKATPTDLLELLARDSNADVRRYAVTQLRQRRQGTP